MSQSRAKAVRRLPTPPKEVPQPEPQAETSQQIQYPSVLVMRIPGEQPGTEQIQIAELNGIDSLSVPTVLRLAAVEKEKHLGINHDSRR